MALRIETFSNASGGNAFFKALTHPLAARRWPELRRRLADGPVAIYDPDGQADALAELYDLRGLRLAGMLRAGFEPCRAHGAGPYGRSP